MTWSYLLRTLFEPFACECTSASCSGPTELCSAERAAAIPKFAYFPFGGGAYICIGNTFAMTEAVPAQSPAAGDWKLELAHPHEPPSVGPMFTLRPAGAVEITVERR
jgi:cytochrome P450